MPISDRQVPSSELVPHAPPPRVFISYSWDSPEHKARVLHLAAALERHGLRVRFDGAVGLTPEEGLQRWMIRAVEESDRVLMVITEEYSQRLLERQPRGLGRGVAWESDAILGELSRTGNRTKFVPVLFDAADQRHIPDVLGNLLSFVVDGDQGFTRLFAALTGQALVSWPRADGVTRLPVDVLRPAFDLALSADAPNERWEPKEGAAVPSKEDWVLERRLGEGAFGEVWLARQPKLELQQVFKFCLDPDRAATLRREVKVYQVRLKQVRTREDIAPILDYRLDRAPYWIATEYSPLGNLIDWSDRQGGLSMIPLAARLEIFVGVAEALAAAHDARIIHKDVKPSNVLMRESRIGEVSKPRPVLTDFGISLLSDPTVLAKLGISEIPGMEADLSRNPFNRAGTVLYMAPELRAGGAASVHSDIYALGVLLYQLVVGDFRRPAEDWEEDVGDELLREDIRRALRRDPLGRWPSARVLADRITQLDARRVARVEQEERLRAQTEEALARSREEEARKRDEAEAATRRFADEASRATTDLARLQVEVRALEDALRRAHQELRGAAQASGELMPSVVSASIECGAARSSGLWALGDFFGVRELPSGRVGLFIGDVSGHGAAAGVTAAYLQGAITAQLASELDPLDVVVTANELLVGAGMTGRFATAWVGLLDPRSRALLYVNAGHGLAFRVSDGADPRVVRLDESGGLPLGVDAPALYLSPAAIVEAGDMLVLVTDGAVEQRGGTGRGEMFGVDRLVELLQRGPREPQALALAVLHAVQAHAGNDSLADDCTVLVVRVPT